MAKAPDGTGSGGPRVRRATPDDIAGLAALERTCFKTDRIDEAEFGDLIARPGAHVLVCAGDNGLCALLTMMTGQAGKRGYIYSLAVAGDQRRRGLGRRLIDHARQIALDAGLTTLELEVRPDNTAAMTTYEAAGFRANGRVEDWYEDGEAAIRMSCDLSVGGRTIT